MNLWTDEAPATAAPQHVTEGLRRDFKQLKGLNMQTSYHV